MNLPANRILVYPVSREETLGKIFPEPMPFFTKKEFFRKKDRGPGAVELWNGLLFDRGAKIGGNGLMKGIPVCQRLSTDYHVSDNVLYANTEFYPSEYSLQKQRHRKSLALPKEEHLELEGLFKTYLTVWNYLVILDQEGTKVQMGLLSADPVMAHYFQESPFYTKKALKEYISRRGMAASPLRHKTLHRLNSIPLDREDIALKLHIANHLASIGGNLRRLISGRIVRKSDKRFLVCFTYTVPDVIREVTQDSLTPSINYCRDPRLVDIGISFSKDGMTVVVQNAFEDREFYCIKTNLMQNTAKFLNTFLKNLRGRVRCIGMDESFPLTGPLLEVRKGLSRRCKALEAVGATEFYIPPKLISLGEQYPSDTPFHDKNHLKVWERKLLSKHKEYAMIQGLTGAPCLLKRLGDKLITHKGDEIVPETMANHALLLALAKLDMWHGATFVDSGTCRTVRKRLDRRKEMQQQKTIVLL